MNVTFLVYNIYGMGGTVRTVVNTANYLASEGHNVEIISVKRTSQNPTFSLNSSIKLRPIFDARRGYLFGRNTPLHQKVIKVALMKIPSLLIDRNEDLYHMFNFFVDLKILSALKRIHSGILVTTIPSFNVLSAKYVNKRVVKIAQEHKSFTVHKKALQSKIKKYYKKLDGLTCLTDYDLSEYQSIFANSNLQVYKVENATDVPFDSSTLDKKVVISAGRLVPEKGFDLLISAFAKVVEKHPDWKLKIFGSGEAEASLRRQIIDEKMYNNIFLMPATQQILSEMQQSSIYALSSRHEGFGMVLIEAMSVGVPCVSFACAGPREIIRDGEDGILVNEGDVDEFARSLMTMIESKELRHEYGKRAKINVERYSSSQIGAKWTALLQELVERKAHPALKGSANVAHSNTHHA